MNAATATTPPQELFRELADMCNLVFSMLTGPQVTVKRWPQYYMVYVEIDGLCRAVSQTNGVLSRGFAMQHGTVDATAVERANTCFTRIDRHVRAIVELLAYIHRYELVAHGRPALAPVVRYHFSANSPWFQALENQYCSGRVLADGRILERTVLPIDSHPASTPAGSGSEHLLQYQRFDLVSEQSRALLGRSIRTVQPRLNQVYAALGAHFVAHCPSVSELLHPRMT